MGIKVNNKDANNEGAKSWQHGYPWNARVFLTKVGYQQFIVPESVTRIRVMAFGGGGAGDGDDVGGSAAYCEKIFNVFGSRTVDVTIGLGGLRTGDEDGTDTIVNFNSLTMTAGGGFGAIGNDPGAGGIATGGDINFNGSSIDGNKGPAAATWAGPSASEDIGPIGYLTHGSVGLASGAAYADIPFEFYDIFRKGSGLIGNSGDPAGWFGGGTTTGTQDGGLGGGAGADNGDGGDGLVIIYY